MYTNTTKFKMAVQYILSQNILHKLDRGYSKEDIINEDIKKAKDFEEPYKQ